MTAASEAVLDVADLSVEFRTDEGRVQAVRGVSYQLQRGEVLGIVGESGSGKSVTSLAVMGLLPGTARVSGSVRFTGGSGHPAEMLVASDAALSRVRGQSIAMIFQDPMTSLNPVYTVGYQIAEAIRAHHDLPRDVLRKQVLALLAAVSIPDPAQRVNSYPHELSGGMRQRVVIAIA
ncbi:MAG: ATP-binding cassette domain-containing protein, partial [Pseudonocardiaceae bacterium]